MTASTQPAIEQARMGLYLATGLLNEMVREGRSDETDAVMIEARQIVERSFAALSAVEAEVREAHNTVSLLETDLRRKDEALRDLIEDAKALYEEVEMAESVGTCLPDRVPSLRLGQRLAALAPVSPSEPVPQQAEEGR